MVQSAIFERHKLLLQALSLILYKRCL